MKTQPIIFFLFLVLPIMTFSQQSDLEVEGVIRIGNNADPSPAAGTIRWNGQDFEGWNGFTWVSLTRFKVESIISDLDGNEYRTVLIGNYEWMAQNLRTTKYSNGDAIPKGIDPIIWENLTIGAYCWADNDSATYENPYGKLYNWYTIMDPRNLCPAGWQVPTESDWNNLILALGGANIAGAKMKTSGTTYWSDPNPYSTNESGFTALPGGFRGFNGEFFVGDGLWWSSTALDSEQARNIHLMSSVPEVLQGNSDKNNGMSVRCIRGLPGISKANR